MEKALKQGVLGATGYADTQESLLSYLQGGRVHPTILFVGPSIEAKFQVARGMAKWLRCKNKTPNRPACNQCSQCLRIEKEVHPDVYVYRELESNTIKIETIRELCHQMDIAPIEEGAKICLLDECQRMTAAAANAFLKSLEEPAPGRFFFLLTTQPGAILPTVRSRCLQFSFKPEMEVQENEKEKELFAKVFSDFLQTRNTLALRPIVSDKEQCLHFLSFLQKNLHQQALASPSETRDSSFGAPPLPDILNTFEAAVQLEGRLRSNANYGLMLEDFLIRHFDETTQQGVI